MHESLVITILEAKNLVSKDDNGLSDPYVVLTTGTLEFRTRYIPETLNPVFNETFVVEVDEYEPVYIEVWDKDRVSSDDFEGGFYLNWWTLQELMDTGSVNNVSFALKKGQGIRRRGEVGGTLVINIRLGRFARRLHDEGKLLKLFPNLPRNEQIVSIYDCVIGRIRENDSISKVSYLEQDKKKSKESKTDVDIEMYPGNLFFSDHYILAYAPTKLSRPITIETTFATCESFGKINSKEGVVILSEGQQFFLSRFDDEAAMLTKYQNQLKWATENPRTLAASIEANDEEFTIELMRNKSQMLRGAKKTVEDLQREKEKKKHRKFLSTLGGDKCEGTGLKIPKNVPLKIYIEDYSTTFATKEAGEGTCAKSIFVGMRPSMTFRDVVSFIFAQECLNPDLIDDYRLFTVLPALRSNENGRQKLTSKWNVDTAISDGLISHGCALEMKRYEKGKSGDSSRKKKRKDVHVLLYCPKSYGEPLEYPLTKDKCVEVTLKMEETLSSQILGDKEVMKKIVSKFGDMGLNEENGEIFMTTLSCEEKYDNYFAVPVEAKKNSPDSLFIQNDDLLVIKKTPQVRTLVEKYPKMDNPNEFACLVGTLCAVQPLLPRISTSITPEVLAERLGVPEERLKEFKALAEGYANDGPISLLYELFDMMSKVGRCKGKTRDAFDDEEEYNEFCVDQKDTLLCWMRFVLFRRYPFMGELHLTLSRAVNLKAGDKDGQSDPFCRIFYNAQLQKSKVGEHTRNPTWDETFVFNISALGHDIVFCVYDWDMLSADDYLGMATFNLLDHLECIDGREHSYALNVFDMGTLFIKVQIVFPEERLLCAGIDMMEKEVEPGKAEMPDFTMAYLKGFNSLESAATISSHDPWLLQEFSARFCLSEIHCSAMKIRALLALEPQMEQNFYIALAASTKKLLKPKGVISKRDFKETQDVLELLNRYCIDVLIPFSFKTREMPLAVVDTVVRMYKDYLKWKKADTSVLISTLIDCVRVGIVSLVSESCEKLNWGASPNAITSEMIVALEKGCSSAHQHVQALINKVVPKEAVLDCFTVLAKDMCSAMNKYLGPYYDMISGDRELSSQRLYRILAATNKIRSAALKDAKMKPSDLPMPAYKKCFTKWITDQKNCSHIMVSVFIQNDTSKPVSAEKPYSASVDDTCNLFYEIMKLVKGLIIDDEEELLVTQSLLLHTFDTYLTIERNAIDLHFKESEQYICKLLEFVPNKLPEPESLPTRVLSSVLKSPRSTSPAPKRGGSPVPKRGGSPVLGSPKPQSKVTTPLWSPRAVPSSVPSTPSFSSSHVSPPEVKQKSPPILQLPEEVRLTPSLSKSRLKEGSSITEEEPTPEVIATLREAALKLLGLKFANLEQCCSAVKKQEAEIESMLKEWHESKGDAGDEIDKQLRENLVQFVETVNKNIRDVCDELIVTMVKSQKIVFDSSLVEGFDEKHRKAIVEICQTVISQLREFVSPENFSLVLFSCCRAVATGFANALSPDHISQNRHLFLNKTALGSFIDSINFFKNFFLENGLKQEYLSKVKELIVGTRRAFLIMESTDKLVQHYTTLENNEVRVLRIEEVTTFGRETKENVRTEISRILSARSENGDLWAAAFIDEKLKGNPKSSLLRNHFALLPSELFLSEWSCSCEKDGKLYLTTASLCFDLKVDGSPSDYSHVIELSQIKAIRAERNSSLKTQIAVEHRIDKNTQTTIFVFAKGNARDIAEVIFEQAKLISNSFISFKSTISEQLPIPSTPEPEKKPKDSWSFAAMFRLKK